MFIVYPTNVDYLIHDVRMRIGDFNGERFSDSIVRTALVSAVKMLQRRWGNRYLVYDPASVVPNVEMPSGQVAVFAAGAIQLIPSGLAENDVFRNPAVSFGYSVPVISQEDEYVVVLAASIIIRRAQLTSSAETFQIWSDGEYSFSNASKARALSELATSDELELERIFKGRLKAALRGELAYNGLVLD